MKVSRLKIVQWALVVAFIVSGCGRRTQQVQDANLSLISAVNGGGPYARMVEIILRSLPCASGGRHAGNVYEVDLNAGTTALTNRPIVIEYNSVALAIGSIDMVSTNRINNLHPQDPRFLNYRNSIAIVQKLGARLNIVTYTCGVSTFDGFSNVVINNTFTGGQLLPIYSDNIPRVELDISQINCQFAQIGAMNMSFQVAGTVNNPVNPSLNGFNLAYSTLDLTVGSIPGVCEGQLQQQNQFQQPFL